MEKEFSKIIVDMIIEFIKDNHLLGDKPSHSFSNNQNKYIFGSQNYGSSLDSAYKDIINFNIFAPISSFNYYGKNYLIQFSENFTSKLFNLFLKKFLNTDYEHLFYSTITKIIPINFCINNQPWYIVRNFLCIPPKKSNGLPSTIHMRDFFEQLVYYKNEPDFQDCLFQFCKNNTSFIKRLESKEYLKKLLNHINNTEKFSIFLPEIKESLTIEKNDFITFYINKKVLFTYFSNVAVNKKQPIEILSQILSRINNNVPDYTKIEQLFIHQEEEKFSELIILIRFSEKINYSFENYYLYLLEFFLNNRFDIDKNLPNVSRNFFLHLKYPKKNNHNKQKTAKI